MILSAWGALAGETELGLVVASERQGTGGLCLEVGSLTEDRRACWDQAGAFQSKTSVKKDQDARGCV